MGARIGVSLADPGQDRAEGGSAVPRLRVSLLGEFRLTSAGREVPLAAGSKRLLALLALRDRILARTAVAGTLWAERSEPHAHGSLRSTLCRLQDDARAAVDSHRGYLRLAEAASVDLRDSRALAHRLLNPEGRHLEADLGLEAVRALSLDLLPDWYEDWVLLEAESWRQVRLHALEALAGSLISQRRYGEGAVAAAAAVSADPLRESARAALIAVQLAEGNQSEALREFDRYRAFLRSELGLEPTQRLRKLVAGIARPVSPA